MQNGEPYAGLQQQLVLAFDVGTTFSGTSYCFLEPGEVPVLRRVTRYPAQEQVGGDAKIPTILYYDDQGNVRAAGAEALSDQVQLEAEENGWTKAEWFKLHLRPRTRTAAHVTEAIPPLPAGKTAVEVFADFLRYLHGCAQTYIEETHASGVDSWRNVQTNNGIEVVLTHPNGWEGGQQALMRDAAIMAGVVPDTEEGRSRLFFVTEGEASLHFCIQSGLLREDLRDNGIVVVDAGGGTVDINAYRKTSPESQSYAEITPSQCAFKGSVFVTRNAKAYLQQLLNGSRFEADIPHITNTFDKRTKLTFASPNDSYYIRFGRLTDNAPELNIRAGQLKFTGHDMAQFFEPSVAAIEKIVRDIFDATRVDISTIFLVGGFGASNWLYSNLKDAFPTKDICRPDNHTNKAVADGAVSYHIDHLVSNRISRYSYGVGATYPYSPSDPEHGARPHLVFTEFDGSECIAGRFSVILAKNTSVTTTQEFREHFWIEDRNQYSSALNKIKTPITCFRGQRNDPKWFDEESNLYSTLCYVQADLSHVPKTNSHTVHNGERYYQAGFDVILSLGLTEFKAYIAWKENGMERRSLAQLVYDPDELIDDVAPMI